MKDYGAVQVSCIAVITGIVLVLTLLLYDRPCQPWNETTQNIMDQFNREGFVIVEDVFTADEIKSVRKEVEYYATGNLSASVVDFVGRGLLPKTLAQRSRYSVNDAAASPQMHEVSCSPPMELGSLERRLLVPATTTSI